MKVPSKLSMILLAVFLILTGLSGFDISFPGMAVITAVSALAAGILMFLDK
ncbi:MAG: hypothetical protein OEZ02_15665 [Anaerolineae bacterium]|nr:hypothetical protein [Anaerolineae bacterium]